jgi:hypothetical protein
MPRAKPGHAALNVNDLARNPAIPSINPLSLTRQSPKKDLTPKIKDRRGATSCDAPAVEGGEGATFAGEDMRPANLSRLAALSWSRGGGSRY